MWSSSSHVILERELLCSSRRADILFWAIALPSTCKKTSIYLTLKWSSSTVHLSPHLFVQSLCTHSEICLPGSPGCAVLPAWHRCCWQFSSTHVLLFFFGKFWHWERKQKKTSLWSFSGSGCYFLKGTVIDVFVADGVIPWCLLQNLIYMHISQ